uniref:Uncharacterized protein n=1 Tax=Arundo donax TaxID=35708 RepID=A0A0A9GXL4_ARUDO
MPPSAASSLSAAPASIVAQVQPVPCLIHRSLACAPPPSCHAPTRRHSPARSSPPRARLPLLGRRGGVGGGEDDRSPREPLPHQGRRQQHLPL